MQFCNTCYFTKHLSHAFKNYHILCNYNRDTQAGSIHLRFPCSVGMLGVPVSISVPKVTMSAVFGDEKRRE